MTSVTAVVATGQNQVDNDMFSDLDPMDPFEFKKSYLSTQLAALASFSGKSRAELAEGLGWKKSRVSKVLSGDCNFTIKTVWEFVSYCGFDFDIQFLAAGAIRPKQPWQIQTVALSKGVPSFGNSVTAIFDIQTAGQVAADLVAGNHKPMYISVANSINNDLKVINIDQLPHHETIPLFGRLNPIDMIIEGSV